MGRVCAAGHRRPIGVARSASGEGAAASVEFGLSTDRW